MSVATLAAPVGVRRRGPLRWVVLVLLAGVLAFGVVLGSVSSARADSPLPLPPLLLGGAAMVGTTAAVAEGTTVGGSALGAGAAVCATGVGCAILGAAAVGVGLYATRDLWMPFLESKFGQGGDVSTPGNDRCGVLDGSWRVDTSPGGVFSIQAHNVCTGNGDTVSMNQTINYVCTVNGGYTTVRKQWLTSLFPNTPGANPDWVNPTWASQCGSMGTLIYVWTTGNIGSAAWGQPSGLPGNVVTYQTTVKCVQADGTTIDLTLDTEGGQQGARMPSCEQAGLGTHATEASIDALVGDLPAQRLWQVKLPTNVQDYPQCDYYSDKSCVKEVYQNGNPCSVGAYGCTDWERGARARPKDYECHWGPYTLPIANCDVLERAYEPEGTRVTQKNTDGDPTTKDDPATDPATGTGTGAGTGTITGPTPEGTPEEEAERNECWPSGWGMFNPASWVLMPTKCALRWAFVPSTDVVAEQGSDVKTALAEHGIGPLITAVGEPAKRLGGSPGGCEGPVIPFDLDKIGVHKKVRPFAACTEPMSTVAGFVYAFSTVGLIVFGGMGFARAVATGFGFEFRWGEKEFDT